MLSSRLLATIAAGVLAATITGAVPAQAAPDDDPGAACQEDVKYLVRAHRGNLAEVAAAAVAMTKSHDRRVLMLAGMLVVDHTKADVRVTMTAARHDVTLPPKPTQQQRTDLAAVAATGANFDVAWLQLQVKAHTMTLDFIDRVLGDGCADDVAELAAGTKKAVLTHLGAARDALDDLGRPE